MTRLSLPAWILCFALLGCARAAPKPELVPASTPTLAPNPTPTHTAIPTPDLPQVTVRVQSERINCRFGPGTVYAVINELKRGQTVRAVGRSEASTWWYVSDPGNPGGFCWVAAEVTETQGEADSLPILPPPFVTVTNVSLRVEPNLIVVNCAQFPQTVFFEAKITANGPTLLQWEWEVSTGVKSNVGTMIFEQAGTQVINEYYQINAPNDYWVRLNILAPNKISQQVVFPVSCTP